MDLMPRPTDKELHSDLKLLVHFIEVYCKNRHAERDKIPPQLPTHDVPALFGRPVELCAECAGLLGHALVKRSLCPLDPKPACKHCPEHCYHPRYRAAIREVMAYSGRRLVLSGRLDYLFHLLF